MITPLMTLTLSVTLAGGATDATVPLSDEARMVRTILADAPAGVSTEAISIDVRRFRFDQDATGRLPWVPGDAVAAEVLGTFVQLNPNQRFCEESFETFDRCVVAEGAAHAILGGVTDRGEGVVAVRVMFVQRLAPARDGYASLLSFEDWEYLVRGDGTEGFRVESRTRIGGGHGRAAAP